MRRWLRVGSVIVAVGLITTAASLVLGQYATQGFASFSAASLNIATLSLGIASSTVANLSGRGIEEYYRRRREEKRIKSALVSYLAGLPLQLIPLSSVFMGLGETHLPIIPKLPDSELNSKVQALILQNVARAKPVDTSYYEKNIKDHLLYLPLRLARQA